MPNQPRRPLRLEIVDDVAVIHFVESRIVAEEDIQNLGDQLDQFVEDGHRQLVLNFSNARYLSSAALGRLFTLKKKLSQLDGQIRFCSIHPDLLEIFRITRLDAVFEIDPDQSSALQAFA